MKNNFAGIIKNLWGLPSAKNMNVNEADVVIIHREIIKSKKLFQAVYLQWYRGFLPAYEKIKDIDGPIVEIGSGAGFMEEVIPDLLKTDVVLTPFVQMVVDAEKLAFEDGQLRGIFMLGVLHHVQLPENFLHEAERCLKPGGRLVLMEPTNNFLQRILCKFLDHYEYFDDTIDHWKNGGKNRMTNANLALPWVIFIRDRKRFEQTFPYLKIRNIHYHTFISLIVTGGMSYRPFLPSFCLPLINLIEYLLMPFMKVLGTSMTIEIEKLGVNSFATSEK